MLYTKNVKMFWIFLHLWLDNDFFPGVNLFLSKMEKVHASNNPCAFKLGQAMTVH